MPAVTDIIRRPLRFQRGPISRGLAAAAPIATTETDIAAPATSTDLLPVDRTGGDQGAGIICGFALCTVGEALGHDHWCDEVMLQQIVDLGNSKPNGVKARFTHPGLSSDGLGSFLGRAKNLTLQGEVVRGDLHFDKTAHITPDGDLAEYAMSLAESDPEAFGASIVFSHDAAAEEEFELANGARWEEVEDGCGTYRVLVGFTSPDPRNVNNYPHARISELRAVDAVDEPAANPEGMFHIPSETLSEANAFLSYALGLTDNKPSGQLAAQINPERARGFAARFLSQQGLAIGPQEQFMSTKTETPPTPPISPQPTALSEGDIRKQIQAEAQKYSAKFGAKGAEWFAQGKTWEEACDLHCEALAQERDSALAAAKEADEKLAALDRGEPKPVETGTPDSGSSYAAIVAAAVKRK